MTNTPSPTDEDRELIAKARDRINEAPMPTENMIDELTDRLESLLSDRAKLEEALTDIRMLTLCPMEPALTLDKIGEIARTALNRSTDRAT